MTVNRSDFQGKPQRSSVDDDALGVFWDPTDPQGEPFVAPKSAFGGSGGGGAGADGKTVRNGAGAPSSGLGVDGDFYIDTAANTIYGPKTGGAWGSPTSLVGPTGANGADGGWDSVMSINAQTGTTYTLVLADQGKLVTLSNASAITCTVPPNSSVAFPVGAVVRLVQIGAGQVTVAQGSGVTVSATPTLKARTQYSGLELIKVGTDLWYLFGDLAVS